jgi:hypothetical protein
MKLNYLIVCSLFSLPVFALNEQTLNEDIVKQVNQSVGYHLLQKQRTDILGKGYTPESTPQLFYARKSLNLLGELATELTRVTELELLPGKGEVIILEQFEKATGPFSFDRVHHLLRIRVEANKEGVYHFNLLEFRTGVGKLTPEGDSVSAGGRK